MKKIVKYYFKCFMIGIIALMIIATISNCVPFGKYLFNNSDSYLMYPQLLIHSIRTIFNGHFFYNLNSFLGSDFYNVRTLYMNSPLNLLFVFFKEESIYIFYTFLLYLRAGLSTLTVCIYLNSISKEKYGWRQIMFSLFYTLSSFGISCGVHIMWMDSFILLPLVILGLDKLIMENKVNLYVITLILAIFINFYIGYALCIFCLIYFIYKSYVTNNFNIKIIKRFIVSSLLCGISCCVVLIPQLFSLMAGRGSTFSLDKLYGIEIFSLLTLPANAITGTYSNYDILSNGGALIYATIFVLVMNILFYFNDNLDKKLKKGTLILTIFFIVSLVVKFIDYSWNMFQPPIWFAHRYIFVFLFFLIVIAFINFENLDGINIKAKKQNIIMIIFSIITIISFACKAKTIEAQGSYIWSLYLSLILFMIYIMTYNKKYYKYLIIVCVCAEIVFNGYNILCENTIYTLSNSKEYIEVGDYIEKLKVIDTKFYRTIIPYANANDSMAFDYYSTVMFSSSYNENIKHFMREKVDYLCNNINNMLSFYENPALLSLFGVKYIVGSSDYFYKVEDNIYLNDKWLSVGFVVPDKIKDVDLIDYDNFNNINKIYSSLLLEDINLFNDVEINDFIVESFVDEKSDESYRVTYSFVANSNGVLVPNRSDLYLRSNIKVNGENKDFDLDVDKIIDNYDDLLIELDIEDKVEVEIIIKKRTLNALNFNTTIEDFGIKILDEKVFCEAIRKLQSYDILDNVNTDNSVISGNVVTGGGTMFLSIPYLDDFTIYVDGKKSNYYKVFDSFIGLDLNEGEHNIVIKYLPKGFKIGVVGSLIGVILVAVYLYFKKNNKM